MLKFFLAVLLCLPPWSWAQEVAPPVLLQRVAADPTWLGLLQVHDGRKTGTASFYWTGSPTSSAHEELQASLAAAQDPVQQRDFACRFPARFYFISQRFALGDALPQLRRCERLRTSLELDRIEGISLVLVGSYFSNPASTFGHTLIRVHQRTRDGIDRDLSFNYGALIPPQEGVLAYVTKGIFGYYQAAYSDQDPFIHNITYSHLENRDSWAYAMIHSPADRLLIVLHLWEMAGAKFQYFFFSRNCAWQMHGSLLLTLEDRSGQLPAIDYWTLPVDVVQDLMDRGKVAQVSHMPSHQRQLNEALDRLSPVERALFETLVAEKRTPDPRQHAPAVINALIDYYTWRNASNAAEAEDQRQWMRLREQAVAARLALPPDPAPDTWTPLASPAEGNKPIKGMLGYARAPWVSATVFAQGPLDPHTLDIGHMEALSLKLAVVRDRVRVDAWTLLDIERIRPVNVPSIEGLQPSWRIRFGAQRDGGLQVEALAAWGLSYRTQAWTGTAYAQLAAAGSGLRLAPSLRMEYRSPYGKMQLVASDRGRQQVQWQYPWSKTYFGSLSYQTKPQPTAGVALGRYW